MPPGLAGSLRSAEPPSSLAAQRGSDEGGGARNGAAIGPIFPVTAQ
jgi:hypothetical protein